jgi:hypothetical protein
MQQLTPPEVPRARPVLITSAQRTIPSLPLTRREDDLELRKVPALPPINSIDPDRPTVVVIDDALLMGVDEPMIEQLSKRAALVGIADNHEALLEEGWAHHYLIGCIPADARQLAELAASPCPPSATCRCCSR